MSKLLVDLDLVRKYNVPGPRYTSYPPATQFTSEISVGELESRLRSNNASARDLSLYFHLPFCQSLCWFCGCTTVITSQQKDSATYLSYLKKELAWMGRLLNPNRKVVQLHLGGGTPTFFLPSELRALGDAIRNQFEFAPDLEASVEVDPRRLNREHLQALREAGFNRASLGVQDHNAMVQKAVHRHQPFALTKTAVDWIRSAGFSSLNIDLIYGLPYQTPASFERTLDEVLYLKPSRLAVFSYAHVPWLKPTQRAVERNVLPTPEVKLELLKLTVEKLTSAGFVYIGMDHFARADDELAEAQRNQQLQRNFQGYSTRAHADVYGFGLSSISSAEGAYWQNEKDLARYYEQLDGEQWPIAKGYVLTAEDVIRREVIMQIMCRLQIDHAAMSSRLGLDFKDYFASELASLDDLALDGLIEMDSQGFRVTRIGRLFLRIIAMRFDAYLPAARTLQFSRAI